MSKILIRAGISFVFLVLLYWMVRDDIPVILQTLKNMNHGLAALATVIFILAVGVMAIRLRLIFAVKGARITLADASNLTFVGYFFNNFLPTSVGGDIVKAMCAARITKKTVVSVTSVLMDRIFGLFTFILIPSISLLFFMKDINNRWVPVIVYGLLAASLLCFFLIFNRSVARKFYFVENILNYFKLGKKIREIYNG